ncbi:MAG TPA: hypothetical protein VNA22_00685 [Pyrinomonadaceae bacterium]|nr:hypothetical protein [Pyrinomonadaceae bacterium]
MKEALFILVVLAVIVVLTAIRYRRQISGMLQIWRTLKSVRQQMKDGRGATPDEPAPAAAGPLVNCARCGTWVPENRAINLRGGVFYCSSTCLETTASVR